MASGVEKGLVGGVVVDHIRDRGLRGSAAMRRVRDAFIVLGTGLVLTLVMAGSAAAECPTVTEVGCTGGALNLDGVVDGILGGLVGGLLGGGCCAAGC